MKTPGDQVTGGKNLKGSQAYPKAYGRAVFQAHQKWATSGSLDAENDHAIADMHENIAEMDHEIADMHDVAKHFGVPEDVPTWGL